MPPTSKANYISEIALIFLSYKLIEENIHIIPFPGAYVPLTTEGNIVVDGVLASCYTPVYHDLAHIGMTPVQWFPKIVTLIFGEDDGFSAFARMTKELSKSIIHSGNF